jgi:Kef-type K+ transport system membrane component KefB
MHDAPAFPFLREILLFLVLAGVLIPLLQRLRVNQVVGFLAAGVALGPFGLGLWAGEHAWLATFTFPKLEGVVALAELGVLFLMFMIGLELSAERLWALRRWVFGAGGPSAIRGRSRPCWARCSRCRRPRSRCSCSPSGARSARRSARRASPC